MIYLQVRLQENSYGTVGEPVKIGEVLRDFYFTPNHFRHPPDRKNDPVKESHISVFNTHSAVFKLNRFTGQVPVHRIAVVAGRRINGINVIQGCEHRRSPYYLHAYSLPVQIIGEDNETR